MTSRDLRLYSWVQPGFERGSPPTRLPAVRVWGDALLEMIAKQEGLELSPPLSIRRSALFAWPTPVPPETAALETAARRRVELIVDASRCAVAQVDLVHDLYDPVSWRRLREWLVDRGHDRDAVDEDLVPVVDPTAPMFIEQGRPVVESTEAELLRAVLDYFTATAARYLETWRPLDEALDPHVAMEIIVPPSAVVELIE